MTNRVCMVCGNDFEDESRFKPRQYCSDNCSDFSKFKEAFEKTILLIEPTPEAKKLIRGDMFRFANILSKSTNTIGAQNVSN
ncbi:hypothetical protein [Sulfurimonas sp.]|uniref:hypothetical protein n=1 Tax=Sulfurimonas sp. TaxID=2022749 RepID=UPI0035669E01